MTSIIKLQALSGAGDESPPCYVLQVDEFKFLLDCGWDEKFDMDLVKELKRHVYTIDAVLLSYPDPLHLGALPYAVGKLGLSCPVYATLPVYKMGQMFMYDLYQSHYNMGEFDLFSLDDVDNAFEKIVQLKYNQTVSMKGKGFGLTITPLPAGHMIGGTIWKIVKEGEEDIVYATDFNHKKERHLNGCELEKLLRPSILITDALNANYAQPRRRTRDEKLMTTILSTLRGGGCVLVCADTAGRVLELAHMLDQLWRNKDSGLVAYSLLMLSNVGYNVTEFAKSMIEWMSDKLMRSFEGARSNPFHLRHLQVCHSVAEVQRTPGPKVVLASFPDLECGFARDLFIMWAPHPQNSIVLTTRTGKHTLARDLMERGGDRTIELTLRRRIRLEGAELEEHLRSKRLRQEHVIRDIQMGISSDSESEDELEMSVITGRHDIPVKLDTTRAVTCFKSNKRHHAMYPFHEERTKSDDYGELIKPEDYHLAEVMDVDGEVKDAAPQPAVKQEEIGEQIEVPTKCLTQKRTVNIRASIQYIDLEGRSDGESLLKIVSQLNAKCVIGLRGSAESLDTFRKYLINEGCTKIYTPVKGEIIDATTESHIYQVKLTDALLSCLLWRKTGDAELARLSGQLAQRHQETINTETEETPKLDDMLTLEPVEGPLRGTSATAAFINELRLSEFKQILAKYAITSEFSSGALWCCNGTIAIRRLESGRVSLEGVLSEEYYKVRELLYDQFAIV